MKEKVQIRAEINGKEMKEAIAKINKNKRWFFQKIKWTSHQQDSSNSQFSCPQDKENTCWKGGICQLVRVLQDENRVGIF